MSSCFTGLGRFAEVRLVSYQIQKRISQEIYEKISSSTFHREPKIGPISAAIR